MNSEQEQLQNQQTWVLGKNNKKKSPECAVTMGVWYSLAANGKGNISNCSKQKIQGNEGYTISSLSWGGEKLLLTESLIYWIPSKNSHKINRLEFEEKITRNITLNVELRSAFSILIKKCSKRHFQLLQTIKTFFSCRCILAKTPSWFQMVEARKVREVHARSEFLEVFV